MSEELKQLYYDAKEAGRTDIMEKVLTKLEAMKPATLDQVPAMQTPALSMDVPQPLMLQDVQQAQQPAQPGAGDIASNMAARGLASATELYTNIKQAKEQGFKRMTDKMQLLTNGKASLPEAFIGVMSETVRTGYDMTGALLSAGTMQEVEDTVSDWAEQALGYSMDSAAGRLIIDKFNQYKQWADKNPDDARRFEDSLVVGTAVLPGVKGFKTSPVTRGGKGWAHSTLVKEDWLDMVRPKMTQKVREEMASRVKMKGLIRERETFKPSREEINMVEHLSKVKGISPKNSLGKNIETLNKQIDVEGKALTKAFKDAAQQFTPKEILTEMRANVSRAMKQSDAFAEWRGAGGTGIPKSVSKVMNEVTGLMQTHKHNLNGLWKIRQKLDKRYKAAFKKNDFSESPKSRTFKEARDTINDIITRKANNSGVDARQGWDRMSAYYKARDNMKTKYKKPQTIGETVQSLFSRGVTIRR